MHCSHREKLFRHRKLIVTTIAGSLAAAAWISRAAGGSSAAYDLLMTIAACVAGIPVVKLAWSGLRVRQFTIPLLVAIAAAGALIIRETWEAAAVTLLYVLGSYLEDLTLERTRAALRNLIDMRPRIARLKVGEEIQVVPADSLEAGQTFVVLPGDRIPADGRVVGGRAAVDTAALTGEPLPAEVGPGDTVLGGSVSQGGHLEVVAERVGPDTTFSRLIYLVAEAQEQRPKVQRFLDRFAQGYTPAIIAVAAGIFLFSRDARLALTFLVIGCPGALVVAAPVAVVAGLGNAARQGILIRGGERLERIGKVDVIAFDKTGTLTQGRPKVTAVVPFAGHTGDEVLAMAAAAEQRSEHHLATAILACAGERSVTQPLTSDWVLEPGLGVIAHVAPAGPIPGAAPLPLTEVLVGNRRLLAARDVPLSPAEEAVVDWHEARGETLALVAAGGKPAGLIAIADPVRPEAPGLVDALRKAGVRHTIMLTGDHAAAANRVAGELGVSEVRASLSPAGKVAAIRELQAGGHVVAMIGDGINDAPALATADVSVAMGASGTQAAIEAADIALMSDRLEKIPAAIGLSRSILAVVRQNVAFAVAVVTLLLLGVVTRTVFLGSGMFIHEASVLLVIANGMRLLKTPRPQDRRVSRENETVHPIPGRGMKSEWTTGN